MIKNKNTEWAKTTPKEAFQAPSFATASLPTTNAANGQIAYDSTTGQIKYYTSSAWTAVGLSASAHAMLSATHSDSTASAVSRGSIITGQDASPTWKELNIGAAGTILKSDGTDVSWGALAVGSITLTTGSLIIGTSSVGAAIDVKGDGKIIVGNGTTATSVAVSGDVTLLNTGATTVTDLTIASEARGDLVRRGASAWERVAAKTSGQIVIGDGTDVISVAVTGDIGITGAGLTSIATGVIVNADVNASAAIAESKLAFDNSAGHDHNGVNSKSVSVGTAATLSNNVTCEAGANDYTLAFGAAGGAYNLTVPAVGGHRTFAFLEEAQAFTAVQTFTNTGIHILDTNASHDLVLVAGSDLTADRNLTFVTGDAARTITLAGALTTAADFITVGANSLTLTTTGATDVTLPTTGTLATLSGGEVLASKTLTAPKIVTTGFIADGGGDEFLVFVESGAPVNYVEVQNANTLNAAVVRGNGSDAAVDLKLYGKGIGRAYICDSADPTIMFGFDIDAATTGKTMLLLSTHTDNRTLTLPNATDTLVGLATSDVLTNKTLTAPAVNNPLIAGPRLQYNALSGDTTLAATHSVVYVDTTAADVTITLPTAVGIAGRTYIVKKAVAGNNLIIDGNAAETIDGAANITLTVQYNFRQVTSDGTNWIVTGQN